MTYLRFLIFIVFASSVLALLFGESSLELMRITLLAYGALLLSVGIKS